MYARHWYRSLIRMLSAPWVNDHQCPWHSWPCHKKGHWFCSLTGQKSCCLSSSEDMKKLTWTVRLLDFTKMILKHEDVKRDFLWQLHNLSALVWEISCRFPTDVPTSNLSSAPDLSLILGQHWTALDSVVDGPSSVPPITTWTNKNTAATRNYRPVSLGRWVAIFSWEESFSTSTHLWVYIDVKVLNVRETFGYRYSMI